MKRLAVLGHPVSHSRSPAMQCAALEELGLGGEWTYDAIDLSPEEFADAVRGLSGEGFVGANVTIPHKEAALQVASDASVPATEIGAANTLSFAGSEIRADNTDAPGLIAALPRPPARMDALVLGAGGSARAAVWALAREGAYVAIWNRTPSHADSLVDQLARLHPPTESEGLVTTSQPPHSVPGPGRLTPVTATQVRAHPYDLIVNCTSVGMPGGSAEPFDELPIDPAGLSAGTVLVDLPYAGGETELVSEARSRGADVVDGLEVLVRQGAESLRIWTGLEPPLDVMREAARSG